MKKVQLLSLLLFSAIIIQLSLVGGTSRLVNLDYANFPQSNSASPVRVLVDVSHGYEVYIPAKTSAMGAFLEGTGEFEITTLLWQEINSSVLTDIDVLVIMHPDPSIPYSSDEIQSVLDFWNNGGSILFVGGTTVRNTVTISN